MQGRGSETSIFYAIVTQQIVPFKSRLSVARSENVCINEFVFDSMIAVELLKRPDPGAMDAVYFGVVILQVLPSVLSYGTGAPASACGDMMPRHGTIQPQPDPSPYTIKPSSTSFQADKPITVVIQGPDYSGVLLEARSGSDTTALGKWQTPPANTKFLTCSGNAQSAITHSNTNIKNNSTVYTWIPPATTKSIYFMATVAQQRTVFWVQIKSSILTPSGGGGTTLDVNNGTDKTVTPVLALIFVLLTNLLCLKASE